MDPGQPRNEAIANSSNPLESVKKLVASFDPVDLLATAAALQLLPENADCLIRIEALAHVACALQADRDKPKISLPKLRSILNSSPLSDEIAQAEDPFPNPFVEEIPFFGGPYTVFPGITNGAAYVTRCLADALRRGEGLLPQFLEEACAYLRAALVVCDAIAKKADLTRGISPGSAKSVVVPAARELLRLKNSVTFSSVELTQLLESNGLPLEVLDVFVRRFGEIRVEEFSWGDGPEPLLIAPIFTEGTAYVVSVPEALLVAATHGVISLAVRCGQVERLARAYHEAVRRSMLVSLRLAGTQLLDYKFESPLAMPECSEVLVRIDNDKFMYVLLLVDTLDGYDPETISDMWQTPGLEPRIASRFKQVEAELYSKSPPPNEILCVLVTEGVGRTHFLGFEEELTVASYDLQINAHDLETIAFLEGSNHLALWRFVRKSTEIRKTARVFAWSTLDEFGLYRKNRHSYYLSDEKPYNVISVAPGFSAPLRVEVLRKYDRHTVPHYRAGHYVEVSSVHATNKIPLYLPFPPLRARIECYVEGYSVPLWIVGRAPSRGTAIHHLYYEFCTLLGYWFWQLMPSLKPILADAGKALSRLTVMLQLPDDPDFFGKRFGADGKETSILVRAAAEESTVFVELKSEFSRLLGTADNDGERMLIAKILAGLAMLTPELRGVLTPTRITSMVDEHAPLGPKKMILTLDVSLNPRLDPRSIPTYRPLLEGEIDDSLDRVCDHFTKTRRIPVGPVAKEETNEVLHECVSVLYGDLRKLIATLDPRGLLEWLVAQNEAVVREDALKQLTIPTRLACFGSDSEMMAKLKEELPVVSRTAIASRFLVEYVVARPPSGFRRISDGLNDQLRGIAYELVTFGMDSDLVKYDLSDLRISMLPSGRLGIKNDHYRAALEAHWGDYSARQIAVGSRAFGNYWKQRPAEHNKSAILEKIDNATNAEFGFSMTELMDFCAALLTVGYEIDPGVVVERVDRIVERISRDLKWEARNTQRIFDFLILQDRPDFLQPPAGFKREHVYPWRFNRPLSYIRRPLLLRRREGKVDVVWGNRHLEASRKNIVSVVMGGRFHATTLEMKLLMGKMRNQDGKEFNDRVARFFGKRPNTIVKDRVKAIGKLSLANLGDIDVLAADVSRRTLYVVECKDLSMARTPYELATEIRELIVGGDDEKSAIDRHVARVDFVVRHLPETVGWLGCEVKASWKICPLVVVDEPLMAPRVEHCPFPVIGIDVLPERLQKLP